MSPPRIPCAMTRPSAVDAQIFHPAARVGAPGPDREDDGQKSHKLGDHAVGVLELHAADQMRESCSSEPNEVGQSGTERPASLLVTSAPAMMSRNVTRRRKDGKPVMGPVVRYGNGLQKRLLEDLCSAGIPPAVRRASCPPRGGRDALRTAARTAALHRSTITV